MYLTCRLLWLFNLMSHQLRRGSLWLVLQPATRWRSRWLYFGSAVMTSIFMYSLMPGVSWSPKGQIWSRLNLISLRRIDISPFFSQFWQEPSNSLQLSLWNSDADLVQDFGTRTVLTTANSVHCVSAVCVTCVLLCHTPHVWSKTDNLDKEPEFCDEKT